jgi:hypothetical protein
MAIFRFLFWLLLLSNLVLLTLIPGPLPGFSSLEPERLTQQLKPESIRLLSNPLTNASAPAAPAPACTEIGDFNSAMASKFEARLARLKLPALPTKQMVQPPTASLVFIPPQPDEASANRRLAQLRAQGFHDVSVVKEPLSRRWGISVGLFSSGELALAQLESLKKAGISDARIVCRQSGQKQALPSPPASASAEVGITGTVVHQQA